MQQTRTTRAGVWLASFFAAIGLLLVPSQPAQAHDVLIESDPEVGSSEETTPDQVRLRFSGTPLTGEGLTNLIRVTDEAGNQWQDGDVSVEGYELTVPLCEGLPQGEYTVAYRVIYSDGHTGEERFNFTNADPAAPEEGTPQDCGAAASGQTSEQPTNEEPPAATSNADASAENYSSASIPAWIWVSAGAGLLVIAVVVIMLLRGSRVGEQAEDPADDA